LEFLRDIAAISEEVANQASAQFGNRLTIIDVAWGEMKGQPLSLVVDNQVQPEAIEPID